ncbi:MAG: serine hydrolase [Planctomycetaceae bacterium]|nr:serine hydrolase [Planctomycetaceae bacterium]
MTVVERRFNSICQEAGLEHCDVVYGTAGERRGLTFDLSGTAGSRAEAIQHRRYLIASVTKPIVAMAVMKLVAEGRLCLSDRLPDLLPEFRKAPYRRILIRNLLTHTSGFPDMLPNNAELRAVHAPLPEFLQQTAETELEFPCATDCRYSSMGFLILGAIIEKLTALPTADYLRTAFFEPLQMHDSWLGLPDDLFEELSPTTFPCILPDWQGAAAENADSAARRISPTNDWNWNSRYWRTLGAPWGGMTSTARDLANFAQMILQNGRSAIGVSVLPEVTIVESLRNQTADIVPAAASRSWGLGWRRQWAAHPASYGDLVSQETAGHWGATGTTLWIDPVSGRFAVILTTTPYELSQSAIQRISNLICSQPM